MYMCCLHAYLYMVCISGAYGNQKKGISGCKLPCECCKSDLDPMEGQPVLLTNGLSLLLHAISVCLFD